MRRATRKVGRIVGGSLAGLGGIVYAAKGAVWLLDQIGTYETAAGVVENRSVIVTYILAISEYWPLAVFSAGVFILACMHYGPPKRLIRKIKQLWPSAPPESIEMPDVVKRPVFQGTTQKVGDNIGGNIAGRDIHHTEYHGVQPPSAIDEASPLIESHEALKALLYEGERLLVDFHTIERRPTKEAVNDYIERTRTCAKRRVFNLGQKEWERFESELRDEQEEGVMLKWAELEDAGIIPKFAIDLHPGVLFIQLYTRVERLRELLAFMTGEYQEPAPMPVLPTFRKRLMQREVVPKVVPPKKESEAERDARLGQVTLPRSGEGMILTIFSLLAAIDKHLSKYSPLLDHLASDHSHPEHKHAKNVPSLLEIEDDVIRECVKVESQTGGPAFRILGQHLVGLKEAVHSFNRDRNARNKNEVLRWTKQTIPAALIDADIEWSTRPL